MGPDRRTLGDLTDGQLVERCRQGRSMEAFEELVGRYQDRVYAIARRLLRSAEDAEDAAQEAFVRAYQALGTFRGKSSFYTWLYRILVNCCSSHVRRAVRTREIEGVSLDAPLGGDDEDTARSFEPAARDGDPGEAADRREAHRRVREAIAELQQDHREVVVLRDVEGMDYEDIAETLGVSRAAVRARLHRARAELAVKLKDLAP